ncbi:MAG: aldehyde ferredoxin oxidoreductase family protein [Anaerolineae bacterium]|nr:aldehyde ferredoxin oxidoreductase family protein [Anaerolineae bacterium]
MTVPYVGRYVRVDLDSDEVSIHQISKADARHYLLGSGYAAMLYAREMDADVEPLDPRNPVYVFNGLLSGTFAPTGCRSTWCGRSPLTGIWNEANVGGHFGAELRAAGIDGLAIVGRAAHPVYLYVHEGGQEGHSTVEVRDARGMWGLDTFDTYDRLLAETDAKARAAVIGPAGENLVHFAAVIQGGRSHSRAAGRGGIGALLGSKQVKGIVARGRERPAYADRDGFRALVRELTPRIREGCAGMSAYGTAGGMSGTEFTGDLPIHNWQAGSWQEGASALSGQAIHEAYWVRDTHCHACPVGCGKEIAIESGPFAGVRGEGPEYETLAGFGAMLEIDDLAAVSRANDLCNRLGLDTISTSGTIAFAFEAFEHGLITLEDTGGVPLAWGEPEGMLHLIELIAARRGVGAMLADGSRAAAARLGRGAEGYAIHVKGLEVAYHDPRAFLSMAINYATANRGACHLEGLTYWPMYGVDATAWHAEPYDRFSNEGAGRQARHFQDYLSLYNPLGLCKFIGKIGLSPETLAELVNAATGWALDGEEMMRTGERIFNLKRVINNRLGITRADDTLPERLLSEPRPSGQAEGQLPDLALMLQEYYEARGWLPDGRPSPERLEKLGLRI